MVCILQSTYQMKTKKLRCKETVAKMQTILSTQHLVFNEKARRSRLIKLGHSMGINKIYDLRVAIYQTGEDDLVLKEIKSQMVQTLVVAERRMLIDFINRVFRHKEIDW